MAFHFFTDPNSISAQDNNQAFGTLPTENGIEKYHLQNKIQVIANAPAFAVTKSLVIAMEDQNNSSVLNMALLPIESNYSAGFPIKFFIYRGIVKASLFDNQGIVLAADNTWDSSNILDIIKKLQDDINEDLGTNDNATSDSLGLQFNNLPTTTFLESLLFDETDEFHPIIVPKGCQIGKFIGGTTPAAIEVILDKIGQEATIGILKSTDRVFEIPEININTSLPLKEQTKILFQNRTQKESVLAYMDIIAFYGACENQGINVTGVSNNTDYLNPFIHKNTVYVDIRDSRGASYNHFFELNDALQIGFLDTNNDPIYEEIAYYDNWPIIQLSNKTYSTNKNFFFIKIPITIGRPEAINILTSYTKKVSSGEDLRSKRYITLNEQIGSVDINFNLSDPIRFKNWTLTGDNLGANYFLVKLDRIAKTDSSQILTPIWNSFFSLNMKNIFSTENIEDGEFRVKTYASINFPLLTDTTGEEIYYPTSGIVADKYHITFFTFYREAAHQIFKQREVYPLKVIDTGRFKYSVNQDQLNYQNENQAVGFLWQLTQLERIVGYELNQYTFSDTSNNLPTASFLKYIKNGNGALEDKFFENFEAITLTHEEYNTLITFQNTNLDNSDYIIDHPLFLRSKDNRIYTYNTFKHIETEITLGIPFITEDLDNSTTIIDLQEYPETILVNEEKVTLTSVITD